MNESRQLNPFFEPISRALSDAWLQIRAKPTVFLFAWLLLSLLPQIVLGFVFRKPIQAVILETQVIMAGGGNVANLSDASLGIFIAGLQAMVLSLVITAFFTIYLRAVMGDAVIAFRRRQLPDFFAVLRGGAQRLWALIRVALALLLRLILFVVPAYYLGMILGLVLGDPIGVSIALGGLALVIAFLHYGLAPFIHLSLGATSKEAILISRGYFRKNRQLVVSLFFSLFLAPSVIIGFLSRLTLMVPGTIGVVLSTGTTLIQSLALFGAAIAYVNFAMNAFIPPTPPLNPLAEGELDNPGS